MTEMRNLRFGGIWAYRVLLAAGVLCIGLYVISALYSVDSMHYGRSNQRVIAPALVDAAMRYGFVFLIAGLGICCSTSAGWKRVIPILFFVLGIPALFIALLILSMAAHLPGEVNRVDVRGRLFMLGIDPLPTDVVYGLWEREGLGWHRAPVQLSYSEDGSWTKEPRLVATSGDDRLLIRRGGIWTDCIELRSRIQTCSGIRNNLDWRCPDQWIRQSEEIERLTGISPGPLEQRQPVHYRNSRGARSFNCERAS